MAQTLSKPERSYHLDNLRTFLTALVIYHHTAIPYGGIGSWSYTSRFHTPASSPPLILFNAIDQTFFMSTFFFLSGHFSSLSLKRKSRRSFLRDKFLRLGIPTLLFTLLGGPAQLLFLRLGKHEPLTFESVFGGYWRNLRGVRGPVWYCALLLIFDTLFSFLPDQKYNPIFKTFQRTGFIPNMALDIAVNFLVRLQWATGKVFVPLNTQLGYVGQYIAAYMLGVSLSGPEIELPELSRVKKGVLVGSSILSGLSMGYLLHAYPETYSLSSLSGGFNLLALSYAVWNETTGYWIGSALVRGFERWKWAGRKWTVGGWGVARGSYAAFVVHPVVLVAAMVGTDKWKADGVVKTAVVGSLGVLGSWAVGWGLLRVPGVGRVL